MPESNTEHPNAHREYSVSFDLVSSQVVISSFFPLGLIATLESFISISDFGMIGILLTCTTSVLAHSAFSELCVSKD